MPTATTSAVAKPRNRRPLPQPLIYRERDLNEVTRLCRKAREDAMRAGTFPKPVPLTDKCRGWLVSDILAWLEARTAERDAG